MLLQCPLACHRVLQEDYLCWINYRYILNDCTIEHPVGTSNIHSDLHQTNTYYLCLKSFIKNFSCIRIRVYWPRKHRMGYLMAIVLQQSQVCNIFKIRVWYRAGVRYNNGQKEPYDENYHQDE